MKILAILLLFVPAAIVAEYMHADPVLFDPLTPGETAERWRPWRSYALLHLWTSLSDGELRSSPKEK